MWVVDLVMVGFFLTSWSIGKIKFFKGQKSRHSDRQSKSEFLELE
jgi:hypothetical protein